MAAPGEAATVDATPSRMVPMARARIVRAPRWVSLMNGPLSMVGWGREHQMRLRWKPHLVWVSSVSELFAPEPAGGVLSAGARGSELEHAPAGLAGAGRVGLEDELVGARQVRDAAADGEGAAGATG